MRKAGGRVGKDTVVLHIVGRLERTGLQPCSFQRTQLRQYGEYLFYHAFAHVPEELDVLVMAVVLRPQLSLAPRISGVKSAS